MEVMAFFWRNRVNMIEENGLFPTIEAAQRDCGRTYERINDIARDVAVYSRIPGKKDVVVREGHIIDGVWRDGPFPSLPSPSLWVPIDNKIILAAIGKLGEEVNECGNAIFRAIIQGLHGVDPKTDRVNLEALQDEIADVRGISDLVIKLLHLDPSAIGERAARKRAHKEQWLDMLRAAGYGDGTPGTPPEPPKGTPNGTGSGRS